MDADLVGNVVVEGTLLLLADEADVPLAQDDEVEVVVDGADDLLGVRDLGLQLLREAAEGAVQQRPEEHQLVQYLLVRLAQVRHPQVGRQLVHQLLVLLQVEVSLHLRTLLNVVVYAAGQVFRNAVLARQLLERLELAAAAQILRTDVREDSSHATDVIGHDDAAEGLDEDNHDSLPAVDGDDIPEADGEHHVGGPVEGPDVDLEPVGALESLGRHPVLPRIEPTHQDQNQSDYVRVPEVYQEHLYQLPILLVV